MSPDDTSHLADVGAFASNTLSRLGFLVGGTDLTSAIQAFQQSRGLSADGELNPITLRALEEARWRLGDRVLTNKSTGLMRGDDIAALQNRLSEMGFNCGKVDGIFGAMTENAVKDFQKSAGVKSDGTCGPATVMALMRLQRTVAGGAPTALREEAARVNRGPALANKVIVIDPSSESVDADIAFDIAQRLEGRLIALGVTVFLTRSASMNPSDTARIAMANSSNSDLVISLHTDNYTNATANGVATYYYGSDLHGVHSVVGEKFAALVQREITARTDLLNCRTHAKTWDLLRLTKAPAVRIDLGYLSNPGDAKKLADPAFRETIVESIAIAIQRLYLASENDAKTGTLRISDLRRAGIRTV